MAELGLDRGARIQSLALHCHMTVLWQPTELMKET